MSKNDDIDEKQDITEIPEEQNIEPINALEELEKELEVYKQQYARALADYKNLERRTIEEKNQIRQFSAEITIKQLLPAIDGLEVAAQHIKDQGLDLSVKQFYSVLESLGVKKIKTVGELYDPYRMECIEVVEGEDDSVVEELSPGYTLHDKIIRIAKVKVGKKV